MKPEYTLDAIAKRLIATREALGFSEREQKKFAEIAGISQNTYNQYEKAKKRPRIDNAIALCDRYGLTLDWIYRGELDGLQPHLWRKLIGQHANRRRGSAD